MLRVKLFSIAIGAAALGALPALAQVPAAPKAPQAPKANVVEPVAHSASVSSRAARLVVHLSNGSRVTIALTEGKVYLNDAQAGTYVAGGPFERAWRAILSK